MLKRLLLCLCLVGCGVSEKKASQDAAEIHSLNRDADRHVYMLMLKASVVEEEYRYLLRQALWTQIDDPSFEIRESLLRREALLNTAGRIAWTLDLKYGDQVTGELLPGMQVLIVESEVALDLATLEGLVDE